MKNSKAFIVIAVATLLLAFFVLIPKLQSPDNVGVGNSVEENRGVLGEPLDIILDFYEKWSSAKISTTTDPYKEGLATSIALDKEFSKRIIENESAYRNEEKDIVICDDSLSYGIKAKEIFSNENMAQILIFPKDKETRGIQIMATLVNNSGYWKITDISCGAGEQDPNIGEFSFDQEGFLLRQSVIAPLNPKYWHLVFTQNDVLGYTTPLIFSANSMCVLEDGTEKACSDDLLFETKKVRAKGDMTEAGLNVKLVEFIK